MGNTPVVLTTNTPIEPIVPPSSKNYLRFIIAGLIIMFIGLFGGYYLVKSNSKPPLKACTMEAKICPDGSSVSRTGPNCEFAPCPQITAIPTPIPDITSNWKTYIDNQYRFEIKYPEPPEVWGKEIPTKQFLNNDLSQGYRLILSLESLQLDKYLDLILHKTQPNITLEDQWSIIKKSLPQNFVFNKTKIKLAGKDALKYEYTGSLKLQYVQWILIQLNPTYFIEINKGNSLITDQILSTFKFTSI